MISPNGTTVVGKKGKSGRKSMREEFAKNQTIKKAWDLLQGGIESKDIKDIALPIALKDMVVKQEHSGEIEVKPLLGGLSNGENNESYNKTTEAKEKA